ncbi:hypothetical protein C1H46_007047 [Malus baccata]|uniref:Uncharacterized protein n=1 Tax=Malus baccata TaxID=106549 RepID=A0A540N8L6_MALBA|nr:hypothetical protein C1H46_007047 [Malus baccata]
MADDVTATFVDDVMQVLIVPPSRVMEACELYRNIFNTRLVRFVNFEISKSTFAEVQLEASVFGVIDFL